MKKIDLIDVISKEISITRSEAKQSVEIILEEISLAVISGKGVEVRGFGGFQKRHRQSRIGINPKTGLREYFNPFKGDWGALGKTKARKARDRAKASATAILLVTFLSATLIIFTFFLICFDI